MSYPKIGILLATVLAFVVVAACRLEQGAADPDGMVEEAIQTYLRQGAQAALPEFERALRIYRARGDLHGQAKVTGQMGNCWLRLAQYERASEAFQQALSTLQGLDDKVETAKALNNLGLTYWKVARYDQARQRFQESLEIARQVGDEKIRGAALGNLGLVYDELGDHSRSLELYQEALAAFQAAGFQKGISDALGNLGGRWLLMGEYESALQHFGQARQASRQAGLKYEEAIDAGNIGLCYLGLGKIDQALSSFEEALRLSRQIGAPKEEADWRRAKGKAFQWAGSYEEALGEFEAASEFYSRAGLPPQMSASLRELGATYLLLGDLASSERYFRQALQLSQEAGLRLGLVSNAIALGDLNWRKGEFGPALNWYLQACQQPSNKTAQATCLMRSSLVQARLNRPQEARQLAQQAFEIAQGLGGPRLLARAWAIRGQVEQGSARPTQALKHYESARKLSLKVQDKESGWRIAYYRGQCLERLGAREDAALAFAESIGLLETLRQRLVQDRFYAGYIDSRFQPYLSLVPLLVEMGKYEQGMLFADRLRSRATRNTPGVPSEIIRDLMGATDHRNLNEEQIRFQKEVSVTPSPRSRQRQAKSTIAELRTGLTSGSALIEYLITGEGLTAFVLTPTELHATVLPVKQQSLTARTDLLRGLLARVESQDWKEPAKGLSRLLIEPLLRRGWLRGVDHLVLVPHGILHYLPFSALLRLEGGQARLLVEDYSISYLPSLQSLSDQNDSGRTPSRGMLALMPQEGRLAHALGEIREIQRLFRGEIDILSGTQASESAFKSRAGHYRTIHLATHSDFEKGNPLNSSLVLEAGHSEDGRLEAHEIAKLRLRADLVVLSACETALGAGYFTPLPPGDDFVSLTRAFLQAGSRSVLASQWKIDDLATARFIGEFYRSWKSSGKAEALAQAQRQMLASEEFAHPYYWAAFVLIGQ